MGYSKFYKMLVNFIPLLKQTSRSPELFCYVALFSPWFSDLQILAIFGLPGFQFYLLNLGRMTVLSEVPSLCCDPEAHSNQLGGRIVVLAPFVSCHQESLFLLLMSNIFKIVFFQCILSRFLVVAGVNINRVLVISSLAFFLCIYFQFQKNII